MPFDEIVVKNPGSCEPPNPGDTFTLVSAAFGDVSTFHTFTALPPLLTTRPIPSDGST